MRLTDWARGEALICSGVIGIRYGLYRMKGGGIVNRLSLGVGEGIGEGNG